MKVTYIDLKISELYNHMGVYIEHSDKVSNSDGSIVLSLHRTNMLYWMPIYRKY